MFSTPSVGVRRGLTAMATATAMATVTPGCPSSARPAGRQTWSCYSGDGPASKARVWGRRARELSQYHLPHISLYSTHCPAPPTPGLGPLVPPRAEVRHAPGGWPTGPARHADDGEMERDGDRLVFALAVALADYRDARVRCGR